MSSVPIYDVLKANSQVTALLGAHPNLRVYEFGRAPSGVARPYLVWQLITGSPDNTLGCPPEYDAQSTQIDIYADNAPSAEAVKKAVAPAIEAITYITSWAGEWQDPATNYYRITFSVDWFVKR